MPDDFTGEEAREWVEATFADPARAAEWIAQHGILAGNVKVLTAHRGQAALRLYLTPRQRRALPGGGKPAAPSTAEPPAPDGSTRM